VKNGIDAGLICQVVEAVSLRIPVPLPHRFPWPTKLKPLVHDVFDLIVVLLDVIVETEDTYPLREVLNHRKDRLCVLEGFQHVKMRYRVRCRTLIIRKRIKNTTHQTCRGTVRAIS